MAVLDSTLPASPQDRLRHSLQLIGFSLALAYALFLLGALTLRNHGRAQAPSG